MNIDTFGVYVGPFSMFEQCFQFGQFKVVYKIFEPYVDL